MSNVDELISLLSSREDTDVALVKKAYDFGMRTHGSQERFSGEPYFIHCFAVAKTLAGLGMDAKTVAAGLIHDTS